MDDKEIITLYWNRNECAIDETAKKYGKYCHGIAYNILHNTEDAEECVSDTFLNAWNSIPPQTPTRLSAFLGRVARNLALNRWDYNTAEKRNGGSAPLVLEEMAECIPGKEDMENIADAMDFKDVLNRFLSALPKEKRIIFLRRYWYFCTIEEIARDFHKSESGVKMMLLRLRTDFRTFLMKEGVNL